MQNLNTQHLKDERLANAWLKANGVSEVLFTKMQVFELQAQITATNILKHNTHLLTIEEQQLLTQYCNAMQHSYKRHKITKQQVYKVLNIGTKINRKLFKLYKRSVINNTPSVT